MIIRTGVIAMTLFITITIATPTTAQPLLGDDPPGSEVSPPVIVSPPGVVMAITAYCLRGTMRSGKFVYSGAVATDPSVIPLGSKLTIEGLPGIYTAEDTGGGVHGNHVDVWFSSCEEAIHWGRQYREVRIL